MTEKNLTFEDLYANGYIQESVNTIAASIVKIHSRLQMYSDDIKQELWLQINNAIKDYSPHGNASPETFFRHVLDCRSINIAERYLHLADCSFFATEALETILMTSEIITVPDHIFLKRDLEEVMKKLTAKQRYVCKLIMEGHSCKSICYHLHISQSFLKKGYILPIRQKFAEAKLDRYLNRH